ncbi:MAG TPA: YbhB/YbcL family Raf kinase inhibitor-like protein [Gemmatirosa sp.]
MPSTTSHGARLAAACTVLALGAATAGAQTQTAATAPRYDVRSPAMPRAGFTLTSPGVTGGRLTARQEANTFGCSGQNQSPALAWRGAPAGTKSFAVTVFDPDAPTGSGFWHWVLYNVPATTTSLPAGAGTAQSGSLPAGAAQATTDYGAPGYGGPCPPPGDGPHRYIFTVHALKVDHVDVPSGATAAVVGYTLHANTLATASFTARYARTAPAAGAQ